MRKCLFVLLVLVVSTPGFADLIVNGSFETAGSAATNAIYWDTQIGGTVLASDQWGNGDRENWNTPPDGSWAYYLKGTWNGELDYGGIWQRVDGGLPNTEYTLSGSFYTDNGFSATTAFKLEFYDSVNTWLGSITTNIVGNIPNAAWTTISMTTTSPVNTARMQVVFEMSGANASGVLGGDNFTLIPEPSSLALLVLAGAGFLISRVRRS